MKQLLIIIGLCLMLLMSSHVVFAQDASTESAVNNPSPTPTDTDYDLPYPGLLPDSPLYFLKIARDWTIEFLISDPVKKPEFDILEANKRLNAGIFILNEHKGEDQLAMTTISKAENYFDDAIEKANEAKKQGRLTTDVTDKLSHAAFEHESILTQLEKQYPKDAGSLSQEVQRVKRFQKQISPLLPK